MDKITKFSAIVFVGLCLGACQVAHAAKAEAAPSSKSGFQTESPRVIYGDDNRIDYFKATDAWRAKADSTVALIKASNLSADASGNTQIKGKNFGDTFNLCHDEPFREQVSAAFCSGSLVAPDIVMTAGHCIRSKSDCNNTKFVFGYSLKTEGIQPSKVASSEIYSCKDIIKNVEEGNGPDFALVHIDRPAVDHTPLDLNKNGVVAVADPVVVIGFPSGIPTKIADGANVRSISPGYFVANLDTYGGNSGSPVFNGTTGLVEGVLVRGETDFVYNNGCRVSNRCPVNGCRGEDVTRIDNILPFLK